MTKRIFLSVLFTIFLNNFITANCQARTIIVNEEFSGKAEDEERLSRNMKGMDYIATGLYQAPNSTLKVNVKTLQGNNLPQILIGTYSRYQSRKAPHIVDLAEGENNIFDEFGGLIYIRYVTQENPSAKASIDFVSGFQEAPFFILGKTTHQQWLKMLGNSAEIPDVMLESKHSVLVFSRDIALQNQNAELDKLLANIDIIINAEDKISGLDSKTPQDFPSSHKYLITESDNVGAGIYMYTTDYRIAGKPKSISNLFKNNAQMDWGLWHELGHMHQQKNWTWKPVIESSVNIYSLAAKRALNSKFDRFKDGKLWQKTQNYLAQDDSQKDFNAHQVSVWMRLVMFEQLRLAFGDKFYEELGKTARRESKNILKGQEEKMSWFMIKSCQISKTDLSEFFKKWGFNVGAETYEQISGMGFAKPKQDVWLIRAP